MLGIIFVNNEYFLYDGADFYGPFHSLADAYIGRHKFKHHKTSLEKSSQLVGFKTIVPYVF